MTLTTVEAVHRELSELVADLANHRAVQRGLVEAGHDPFYDASHGRGISIAYHEAYAVGRDADWKLAMNDTAVEAAREALVAHGDLLAGLILGVARTGENYFTTYGARQRPVRRSRNRSHGRPRGRRSR